MRFTPYTNIDEFMMVLDLNHCDKQQRTANGKSDVTRKTYAPCADAYVVKYVFTEFRGRYRRSG